METSIISTKISLMSHFYLIATNGTPGEWIVSKEQIRIDLIFKFFLTQLSWNQPFITIIQFIR